MWVCQGWWVTYHTVVVLPCQFSKSTQSVLSEQLLSYPCCQSQRPTHLGQICGLMSVPSKGQFFAVFGLQGWLYKPCICFLHLDPTWGVMLFPETQQYNSVWHWQSRQRLSQYCFPTLYGSIQRDLTHCFYTREELYCGAWQSYYYEWERGNYHVLAYLSSILNP